MNNLEINKVIKLLGDYKKCGNEYLFQCPYCIDKSRNNFSYNVKKNFLWCFASNGEHSKRWLKEVYNKTDNIENIQNNYKYSQKQINNYFNQMIKTIQKNIEQEEKEAEEQKAISAEKQKIRDEYLKFDNYTWEVKTVNYQNRLIITVEIENLKNIDIEAFEGVINISDKLDNNLGDFKIKNTKVIPKKAKADVDITFYDDEYYTEIKTIRRQNGDLYFSFTPTKLIVNGQEI